MLQVAGRRATRFSTSAYCLLVLPASRLRPVPSMSTIFQRIIDREIPADIVYEDDRCLAFRDIDPKAPAHVLVIPKKPIVSVAAAEDQDQELLGHLLCVVRDVARQLKLDGGYRVVANIGPDGGQSVDHLHFHLLGGRPMKWPPG